MTSIAITRAFPAAIAAWAESTTRPDAPRFDEYVQAKRAILDDFFTFVGKHPKDVAPADVLRWRDELAARGYSPTTVYGLVCRVSSFYNFVMKDDIISRLIGHNPTKAVHPDAPHPYQNRSAQALEDDDVQAILAVIRRRATEYLHAKRDHALFLLYILTGMRRAEVIGLRWGDVRTGEVMRIKTIAKGGYYVEREVTNPRAQTALLHYLSESDRLSSMKPETPLSSAARPRRQAGAAAHLARLRAQPQEVRAGGRRRQRPPAPDAAHVRAHGGGRHGQYYRDTGRARSQRRAHYARVRAAHCGQEGQAQRADWREARDMTAVHSPMAKGADDEIF